MPNDKDRTPPSGAGGDAPARRLKVLELGTQFGVGGITRHVRLLGDWLRARGHEVTFGGTPDAWGGPDRDPGFVVLPTRYVAGDGGSMPARLRHLAVAVWRLRRWLRRHRPDLIHAHESAPCLVADLARKGLGIPLAVTYHGSEPERVAAFASIASRADLVITPSHRSGEDLVGRGGLARGKLKVMGLGLPPAPAADPAEVAALRARLLGDGERVIVTIARMVPQKGIDILIGVAAELRARRPGYRFVVVGDGPDEDALKALARGRGVLGTLHFAGRTATPHLYLRAADLFLLTSRWEALPFTIVEAFQAGTPAVATACSGVVELIDATVGATPPVGDVAAIAAAVEAILEDEPRRAAMAGSALARSREDRFDLGWVHARFEETYRALARR
ncbi:MAG: glycosyltransferase family 4 protein [Paracoccaceae bacterium]